MTGSLTLYNGLTVGPKISNLKSFLSELMMMHDEEVAKAVKGGAKFTCRWMAERTMAQTTVASLHDSAYGYHSDQGFHHNTNLSYKHVKDGLKGKLLEALPTAELMRVVTVVLCTKPGINSYLVFSVDNGKGGHTEIGRVPVDECTVHMQLPGMQKYFVHMAECMMSSGPQYTMFDGTEGGEEGDARLVISMRVTLDHSQPELLMEAIRNCNGHSHKALSGPAQNHIL